MIILVTIQFISEILLYFIFQNRVNFGISLTLSRLLLPLSFTFLIYKNNFIIPKKFLNFFKNKDNFLYIFFFILYIFIISFIGSLNGNYEIYSDQIIQRDINILFLRPAIDIFNTLIIFIQASLISNYIKNKPSQYKQFIMTIIVIILLFFVVGITDLIVQYLTRGPSFIGRHFYENIEGTTQWLGNRFHSLAGEPRDAIPALCLFWAILKLISNIANSAKINLKIRIFVFPVFFIAFLFTKSMTGLAFIILYLFYYSLKNIIKIARAKINKKYFYSLIFLTIFCLLIFNIGRYIGLSRIFYYSDSLLNVLSDPEQITTYLEIGRRGSLFGQLPDLNIFIKIIINIYNGDFSSLIFGNGLGNSGYYNANTLNFDSLALPFSDLARWLFDIGFLGLIFYFFVLKIFIKNIIKLNSYENNLSCSFLKYEDLFILVLASSLSHKSYILQLFISFIFIFTNTRKEIIHSTIMSLNNNKLFKIIFK